MKLIYRIGKAHGCRFGSGHIKDLIAIVGLGLTSRYLERQGARRSDAQERLRQPDPGRRERADAPTCRRSRKKARMPDS
ncbi:MAG: hypothetical protein ACRYGA_14535 [Janthinobacterium lividum]